MGRMPGSNGVQVAVDGASSIDLAVVRAISRATGLEPSALPPLYGSIDPDALGGLVTSQEDALVRFEHAGCAVLVDGEAVTAEPL